MRTMYCTVLLDTAKEKTDVGTGVGDGHGRPAAGLGLPLQDRIP
jgi:hypothetical protein